LFLLEFVIGGESMLSGSIILLVGIANGNWYDPSL